MQQICTTRKANYARDSKSFKSIAGIRSKTLGQAALAALVNVQNLLWFENYTLEQGSPNHLSEGNISHYTTIRVPDFLRNVIASGNVAFYEINKFFVNIW